MVVASKYYKNRKKSTKVYAKIVTEWQKLHSPPKCLIDYVITITKIGGNTDE